MVVYLSPSETVNKTDQDTRQDAATKTVQDTCVRSLEDQVRFLREELERKYAILLNLTERIPQLEAAQTIEELPERAEGAPAGPQTAAERHRADDTPGRPWWRLIFGG